MDSQAWGIVIFGSLFVAFSAFTSFMADRQKDREKDTSGHHPGGLNTPPAKPEL